MKSYTMALFGEAEKGEFSKAYYCKTLPQLAEYLGNPPPLSRGLFFAVQALMFNREIIFIRVKEEGISHQDYLVGLNLLRNREVIPPITAVGIPGVGTGKLYEAVTNFCYLDHSVIVITEGDLYDYLTEKPVSVNDF